MSITCPDCHAALEPQTVSRTATAAIKIFPSKRAALTAISRFQVLKACGAVDYFCQNGHGLISKKRVEFVRAGA